MKHFGLLLLAATLTAAACGGQATSTGAATQLSVTLTDNSIVLDRPSIPAGTVTLTVANKGSVVHSLVLLKTDVSHDKIPADPMDQSKVQETGKLAGTGQIAAGATATLSRELAAGTYVLVCNEPAHYLIGMHLGLVVK